MLRSKAIFHRQVFAALAAGEQLSEKAPDDVLSFSQRLLVWFFVIIPQKPGKSQGLEGKFTYHAFPANSSHSTKA